MNHRILAILVVMLGALSVFSGSGSAQDNPAPEAQPQQEVMGENDRLPFMQQEQGAAPSSDPGSGSLLLKTLGSMLLIVGLIFGGAWGAKKLGFGKTKLEGPAAAMDLKMLDSISLGNGRTISTVKFGDRILVVGSTPQSFTLLAEEETGEQVEESAVMHNPRSVAEMLAEENLSFGDEFQKALNVRAELGGRI